MNAWTRWVAVVGLTAVSVWWLSGCSKTDTHPAGGHGSEPANKGTEPAHTDGDHRDGDHKDAGHKDGHEKGGHDDKPLTEKDVKMPDSFKAGVARLEELNKTIAHHIEHGELAKVHRVAEEMALVAKKMKELARKDVPEDKQTEAGRLCNEVSGYYKPIDEAADAGKKPETEAIHKKMIAAVEKLKDLAK